MKFGVREIANVVFRAKSDVTIGGQLFRAGQPVLYIDTAKTSTIEGAATSVYATGGRGNTRLIAWEGEKTLTFTVEDALISPIGLSVLTGAGLIKGESEDDLTHVHVSSTVMVNGDGTIADFEDLLEGEGTKVCVDAPVFAIVMDRGSLTGELATVNVTEEAITIKAEEAEKLAGKEIMLDFYVLKKAANVSEIQIDAENFAGYYYVEADTLFRRQEDGVDLPANITLPKVKIQSNFTFSMASSGDPSTFTFTMDAMPGYTYFDRSKKVLCVIQVIEDTNAANANWVSVMDKDKANFHGLEDGSKIEDLRE